MLSGGSPWPVVAQTNITRGSLIRFASTERHRCKSAGCTDQARVPQPGPSPSLRVSAQRDSGAPRAPAFLLSLSLPLFPPLDAKVSCCCQTFPVPSVLRNGRVHSQTKRGALRSRALGAGAPGTLGLPTEAQGALTTG